MSTSTKMYTESKSNGNVLPFRGTVQSLISEKSTLPQKSSKLSKFESEENQNERELQNKVKAKNKQRRVCEGIGEESKAKMSKYDPSALMNKLEEFSNVWNDYPDVSNGNEISSHWFKDNDDVPKLRSTEGKDKRPNENNYKNQKDKSYSQIVSERKKANGANFKDSNFQDHTIKDWTAKNYTNNSQENDDKEVETNKIAQPNQNSTEKYDSKLADLKRKKAVQEQRQLLVEKKNIIKQALSSIGGKNKINKKIIFSDTQESERSHQPDKQNVEQDDESKGRQKLFEEEDESDFETDFKLNHQFEGKKGQKLLELQSRFASDPRFNLDKRFYESGSEESEHEMTEDLGHNEEKKKQLAILESIVNQQIKPLSEIKKSRKNTDDTFMVRFDPSREDHEKYIVRPQDPSKDEESVKKKKKKKEVEEIEVPKNAQNNSEISKEKFFTVKEDLKETLRNESGAGFSLLKLFGSKEEPDNSDDKLEDNSSVKKLKHKTKNPFKYDSSESEPEQEEPKIKIKEKPEATSWRTTFFFTENDARFQEASEFLKVSEDKTDIKDYAEKRKILKDFIRHKVKNNNRKKIHFKKKLGGFKKAFKTKKG